MLLILDENKKDSPVKELASVDVSNQVSPPVQGKRSPSPNIQATPPFKTQASNTSIASSSQQQTINSTKTQIVNTSQRIQQKLFKRSNMNALSPNSIEIPPATNTQQTVTNVTHLASVNALLDFYCAIAENGVFRRKKKKF